MSNIQQAIVKLLLTSTKDLNGEEVFLRLNAVKKTYSYAAVYTNLRKLVMEGVLVKKEYAKSRTQRYGLHEDWTHLI